MNTKFGKGHISDLYPGFVWRNGFWYRIKRDLKFKPHSVRRLRKWQVTEYLDSEILCKPISMEHADRDIPINDSYVPVFINDLRYFVRPIYYSYDCGRGLEVLNEYTYVYVPYLQGVIKVSTNRNFLETLIYEDDPLEKPRNIKSIEEWRNIQI